MNKSCRSAASVLAVSLLLGACASPRQERVILLPDPSGHVGVIDVTSASGTTRVTEAYAGARVKGAAVIAEPVGQPEVSRRYGPVLDGLPPSPQRYMLNFEFATDVLTAASRAAAAEMQKDLVRFPAPEVVLIGHTDAIGTTAFNDRLSLDRANRIRDMLIAAGIPREAIQTVARGAREPLVPSPQGVREPRNRRVEIKLR